MYWENMDLLRFLRKPELPESKKATLDAQVKVLRINPTINKVDEYLGKLNSFIAFLDSYETKYNVSEYRKKVKDFENRAKNPREDENPESLIETIS